jgi:hypothetical protein
VAQNPKCQLPGCDRKGKLHDAADSNDTSQTLWLYICDECWGPLEDRERAELFRLYGSLKKPH